VGPLADEALDAVLDSAPNVVAAWGASYPAAGRARVAAVRQRLVAAGARCLGTTSSGEPRHPLYVAAGTPLQPLPPGPTQSA